jgi:hypothetical protein
MTVLIEDQASGTQLIHELVADGLYAVTRYQPQSALTSPIDLAIPGLRVRHQASCALSGRLAWVGKDDLGLPSVIADLPAHPDAPAFSCATLAESGKLDAIRLPIGGSHGEGRPEAAVLELKSVTAPAISWRRRRSLNAPSARRS